MQSSIGEPASTADILRNRSICSCQLTDAMLWCVDMLAGPSKSASAHFLNVLQQNETCRLAVCLSPLVWCSWSTVFHHDKAASSLLVAQPCLSLVCLQVDPLSHCCPKGCATLSSWTLMRSRRPSQAWAQQQSLSWTSQQTSLTPSPGCHTSTSTNPAGSAPHAERALDGCMIS